MTKEQYKEMLELQKLANDEAKYPEICMSDDEVTRLEELKEIYKSSLIMGYTVKYWILSFVAAVYFIFMMSLGLSFIDAIRNSDWDVVLFCYGSVGFALSLREIIIEYNKNKKILNDD